MLISMSKLVVVVFAVEVVMDVKNVVTATSVLATIPDRHGTAEERYHFSVSHLFTRNEDNCMLY